MSFRRSSMSVTENSPAPKFRVNPDYVLRDICGEYAIIPVGEECLISNAVMTPNESAAFIWKSFMEPNTVETVVRLCIEEYDAPEEALVQAVQSFVRDCLRYRMLLPEE